MHEMALCHSIYTIADGARDGRPVEVVHVRVGALRQVVPDTLEYCWELLTEWTPLSGARLEIEHVPVTLQCRDCGSRTVVTDALMLSCGGCAGWHVDVVAGEELLVESLELGDSPVWPQAAEARGDRYGPVPPAR
ncbi:MAG: hydrogenase maturation nickel metallochaperone HypA [Intrasporangium sp.]|uniref:hydrogenase maturation nickel metallochaperone HypA n=1 Tax=Intrasporangium sp. TaxID=1925024 RepID=UPI003F7CFA11